VELLFGTLSRGETCRKHAIRVAYCLQAERSRLEVPRKDDRACFDWVWPSAQTMTRSCNLHS